MRINFILATLINGGMGVNNTLPWHLPEDLRFFKKMTLHRPVVMGYKTFESLNNKPLPSRDNYIISRDVSKYISKVDKKGNLIVVDSFDNIFKMIQPYSDVFVIGGSKTFELFEPYVKRIYHTVIDDEELNKITCDTHYVINDRLPLIKTNTIKVYDSFYIEKYTIRI